VAERQWSDGGVAERVGRPESVEAVAPLGERATVSPQVDELVERIAAAARPGDHVLVMSNGAFGGIHGKLLQALKQS